jgi:hypothetical protein
MTARTITIPRWKRQTREILAESAGKSGRTLDKYEKIVNTASPKLLRAVRNGDITVHAASRILELSFEIQTVLVAVGWREVVVAGKLIALLKSMGWSLERIEEEFRDTYAPVLTEGNITFTEGGVR